MSHLGSQGAGPLGQGGHQDVLLPAHASQLGTVELAVGSAQAFAQAEQPGDLLGLGIDQQVAGPSRKRRAAQRGDLGCRAAFPAARASSTRAVRAPTNRVGCSVYSSSATLSRSTAYRRPSPLLHWIQFCTICQEWARGPESRPKSA
jgi:hypothetical protein